MADPRIEKLAKVLVHYSLGLKAGQQIQIRTHPIAEDLTQAVYEEVIKVGANPFMTVTMPGLDEIFFKYASDAQLDYRFTDPQADHRNLRRGPQPVDRAQHQVTERHRPQPHGARQQSQRTPLQALHGARRPQRAGLVPDRLPLPGHGPGRRHGAARLPRVRLRRRHAQ